MGTDYYWSIKCNNLLVALTAVQALKTQLTIVSRGGMKHVQSDNTADQLVWSCDKINKPLWSCDKINHFLML